MARYMEDCIQDLPSQCLSQMAEIVEIVLKLLPGRSLESAALVCKFWREIANRIRRTRREFVTLSQAVECASYKPLIDFSDDLFNVANEPQAALLFTSRVSTFSEIPCYKKEFTKQLKLNSQNLPRKCTLIGCTGLWVDQLGREGTDVEILDEDGRKYGVKNSMVLIPRVDGIQSCGFHLPLRDKYKSISGMASFLPKMDLTVRLVIALVHPVSLGKLTGFAVRTKKEYGEQTVIVGVYSDCALFHSTNVTYNEIVGLVLAGNLKTSSIIINGSRQNEVLENLHKGLVRLKSSGMPTDNAIGIIFSAPSHLRILKQSGLMKCKAFQHHFAGVPVVVVYGTAVYGCDTVELDKTGRRSGGRDFLHTGSSVLCMMSFKN